MEQWRLIDLNYTDPYTAQTFYEAVAEAVHRNESPNTLILLQPDSPYACIGYHQDLEKELDMKYLKTEGLPAIRRSQGGGATYLDKDQVFYQIIFKNTKIIPRDINSMFEKLLQVTAETYRKLGVPATYKPLNDVVVNGRKISGNGAGQHESATILVGNIIQDLNYEKMANVLRVPNEKFRDKMKQSMQEWVTTLKRELGEFPPAEYIKSIYAQIFQELLGIKLIISTPTVTEFKIFTNETKPRHKSKEWLYMDAQQRDPQKGRTVKIAHGVKLVEIDFKAGKLLRIRAEMDDNKINNIQIRGDYFIIPKEAINTLEQNLKGIELMETSLEGKVNNFFKSGVEISGFTSEDLITALMKIKDHI